MRLSRFLFLQPLFALALTTSGQAAIVLYDNPFLVPGGTGSGANLSLNATIPSWSVYNGASGTVHTGTNPVWITDRPFKDAPPDTYGYLAWDGFGGTALNPKFTFTTGLNIDSTAQDLTFNWLMGNANTTPTIQIAVQVGGQWYASASTFTTLGQTFGQFADVNSTTAEEKNLVFSATASNWNILNFTPDSVLSMGGTATSDLSDPITGVGFFSPNSTAGNIRIANFNITAVPEPSTYALGMIGLAVLACAVRRQRRKA